MGCKLLLEIRARGNTGHSARTGKVSCGYRAREGGRKAKSPFQIPDSTTVRRIRDYSAAVKPAINFKRLLTVNTERRLTLSYISRAALFTSNTSMQTTQQRSQSASVPPMMRLSLDHSKAIGN